MSSLKRIMYLKYWPKKKFIGNKISLSPLIWGQQLGKIRGFRIFFEKQQKEEHLCGVLIVKTEKNVRKCFEYRNDST